MEPEVHSRWKGVFTLGREYGEDEVQGTSFMEDNEEGQFKEKSVDYAGHGENYNPASIN
jgi:hypothetical protein